MSTEAISRHFRNPHNRREMTGAAGTGRAGDAGCGAEITIYIRFDDAVISEATFVASGSSAIIAAGSVLTEKLRGLDWMQAAAIPASALFISLAENGGDESEWERLISMSSAAAVEEPGSISQACEFSIDAFHRAIEDVFRRGASPQANAVDPDMAMVAMSGGVDSSTACLLEQQAGRRVIGVTMRLWDERRTQKGSLPGETEKASRDGESGAPDTDVNAGISCCSPESIRDARQVCHGLGIPHLTVDYTQAFEQKVVADFVAEYLAGRTPNPCTICNGSFRFPALVELAGLLGAGRVATGHYARVVERQGAPMLARGVDKGKDQSYMLWGIEQPLLPWLEFPLGEIEKVETRELAREAGLKVHDRVDSQDVCFIPDDDYRRFVVDRADEAGGSPPGEGEIVTADCRIVGYHRGYLNFTVGQRRGLGISSAEPLYVISTDPESNRVVVGTRDELAISHLELDSVNAFLPLRELEGERSLKVQVRYNSPAVGCTLSRDVSDGGGDRSASKLQGSRRTAGTRLSVEMVEPVYGVAPGQSAVLYVDDVVAAGGRIV